MRGDLVYEKLGEIDPALVAEALPDAVPLYRLGGEDPKPPKKRPNLRKALVICACLFLAGILLVGGSIALSRSLMPSPGTEPVTDSDGRTESLPSTDLSPGQPVFGEDFRIYDGLGVQLLYVGIDPAHTDEITELQTILSRAVEPLDSAETAPSLYMTVGDTTYAVTRGAVFDQSRKETYALANGDWERFRELVETIVGAFPDGAMTLPVVLDYKEQELHPLDAYVCSLPVFAESEYASLYEISEVYLRLVGSGSEYRTPAFTAVEDRDAVYRVSIPEDAPLGDYELVVLMHSDHSAGNTDLEIISRTPAVTVAAHEKEPRYVFFYECEEHVFPQGEMFSLTAGLINRGDDIYRWSTELSILPTVQLRTVRDGETLTYPMTTGLELEWSGDLYHMTYNEPSKADFWTVTPDLLPVGVYDLVLSFEGHEEVFENAVAVMDPDKDCSYDIAFTVTDTGDERTLKLYVTLRGKDVYRYGSSTCFAPDSLYLICEDGDATGVIVPELTAVNDGPIVEDGLRIRHWKEGDSMSFTYTFQIDLEDEINGTIPGVHDLVVNYKGEESVRSEGALTVVAP